MGGWTFVDRRLEAVLEEIDADHTRPQYVGRVESASPATGSVARHRREHDKLVDEALTV
jgi:2-oxoglutarate dehydrogenase E1 component